MRLSELNRSTAGISEMSERQQRLAGWRCDGPGVVVRIAQAVGPRSDETASNGLAVKIYTGGVAKVLRGV